MTMHLDFQKQSISLWRREVYLGSEAMADFDRHTPLSVGLGAFSWPSTMASSHISAHGGQDNRAQNLLTKHF